MVTAVMKLKMVAPWKKSYDKPRQQKEHIWVSSNDVDETRAYYTEWGKSERETPIQYINAYIMEFRKMVRTTLQVSKKETDIKDRLFDSVREGEGGMIWENSIETCILPYVK